MVWHWKLSIDVYEAMEQVIKLTKYLLEEKCLLAKI